MHGIKERLRRIGAAVQRLPERARRKAVALWRSPRARRVAGHTALLALALLASPYLLAAWRIALYGGQTDQGALIVIIILIVYGKDMCHEWLETRHERQKERKQAERHDGSRGDRPARRRKRNKALRGRSH